MVRQIFLWVCFVVIAWLAFVHTSLWLFNFQQPVLAQVSPLASPLTVTIATTASTTIPTATISTVTTPVNGSPISVVLVALVFLGIIAVAGLVIWRRR